MGKFRKKSVIIEAWPVNHLLDDAKHNWPGLPQPITDAYDRGEILFGDVYIDIKTIEGTMRASLYDWVIEGVKGELYPCKPDIFEMTYERHYDTE